MIVSSHFPRRHEKQEVLKKETRKRPQSTKFFLANLAFLAVDKFGFSNVS
jgi:hypothetical protein